MSVNRRVQFLLRGTAVLAALGLAAATLAAPASAATTAQPKIHVAKSAAIFADGVGLVVNLSVRCDVGQQGQVFAEATQVVDGGFVVDGSGYASPQCTGQPETISIGVFGFGQFATGPAFVTGVLDICDEFTCTDTTANKTVQISEGGKGQPAFKGGGLKFKLPKTATIEAGGAGAVVLVPYTCDVGVEGSFDGYLSQMGDQGFPNTAETGAQLTCTDENRTGVLAFHALSTAWLPGAAFLIVNAYACSDTEQFCSGGSAYREINLG